MNGNAMVARNVRRIRHERRLSIGALAHSAGLAKQTLANLENGTGNPTVETLFAVAGALGIGVNWLLTEWGSPVLVQRADEAAWAEGTAGRTRQLDQIYGSGQVRTLLLELSGKARDVLPAQPTGTLHHALVLHGTVLAGPAEQETALDKGDFIRFPGDVPHLFQNTSPRATVHLVTTVPQAQQFSPLSI